MAQNGETPVSDSDEVLGDDADFEKITEEFDAHRQAIYERVCDYMDETDIEPDYVVQLLIDMLVRMRMTAYGLGVENPSAHGLKLDLDPLQKEVSKLVRQSKKAAEDYIAQVKIARAEAEAEEDGEGPG